MNRRNTIQRDLVLEAVKALSNHPTPEQVYVCVSARFPGISKSTVYRNLNILCDDGALLRIPMPNAAERVDHNIAPHYHAICRNCGCVSDVSMRAPDLAVNPPKCKNFVIEDMEIIFTGICADCKLQIAK
ncbi:MAG TPA: transcriptional repressor [Oscillospiraceae bacterium]|nr:transcriptional repressor [Oscillospiraceae bacterium]HPS35198.1 transcriptional repressor [Oscillospiraceae bacterium]